MDGPVGDDDPVRLASALQLVASDPAHSAFVSASAGSGKTKLLIDRLLRLMLPGEDRRPTAPDRILCLTFTKAAAAEMAIRLRRRLGDWVALDDAALDRELAALDIRPADAVRRRARALFAAVLDMPGGLRIGTIHGFCEGMLRRFPLEARISPHFRLVDETDGRLALGRAREAALGRIGLADAVELVASVVAATEHEALVAALRGEADRLRGLDALAPEALASALRAVLGVAETDEATLLDSAVGGIDEPALAEALALLDAKGTDANRATAALFRAWLARDRPSRATAWPEWVELCCTEKGAPRQVVRPGKLVTAHPEIADAFRREAERIALIEDRRGALRTASATAALLALCGPALALYADTKEQRGLLDFDDLVRRTGLLLDDPGVAWVLFKLDGGLDHLLLDEVQDTSAVQWRIAGKLTEEFFSGADGEAGARTVFAVGDFKQSIYSFQGADPDAFHRWRGVFRDRAEGVGLPFREPELAVSFRSAAPVLDFVDAVFADPDARGGVAEAGRPVPRHRSSRPDRAGRVELWPLALDEDGGAADARPWVPARRNRSGLAAPQRLAASLAERIRRDIGEGRVRAGDVLVLVRRRGPFARALVRALKERDVPVAGLDRMVLTEQPAVVDLLALADTVLLPEDDLALATVLTSPLGFTDDDGLTALALGRTGAETLWDTLRRRAAERDDWQRSLLFVERLRRGADWTSPHGFLSLVLGPEGGRARLFARLGPESGEAIDELLTAALEFAARAAPSLGPFVHSVRRSGAEVKRETPENSDEVRLMTVHGAKGLQGRLVVLADTTGLPKNDDRLLWSEAPDAVLPFWVPTKPFRSAVTERLRERSRARAFAEYNRLLYVALTRAEDGLIVCGAMPGRGEVDERSWYASCRRAMAALPGAAPLDEPLVADPAAWHGAGRRFGDDAIAPADRPQALRVPQPVPARLLRPLAAAAGPRARLAPSRPENVHLGPKPAALSPLRTVVPSPGRATSRRRGDALHALLQLVPSLPPDERRPGALRFARALLPGADDAAAADALADEALRIVDHPALAAVFGPDGRAEQRVAGLVDGITVDGVVDRVLIGPDAVDLVDFKSGRRSPPAPERTPVFYLRQMSAYRAVLEALVPGRPVRCALVWTTDATVVHLPPALLDRHRPGSDAAPVA